MVILLCLIGVFIQFIISKTTQSKLSKAVAKIKDSALVISIEMNKAKAAHVAYEQVSASEAVTKNNHEEKNWKKAQDQKLSRVDAENVPQSQHET